MVVSLLSEASRASEPDELRCRFCDAPLRQSFVDLGVAPLANSYLTTADLGRGEIFYPLHAYVCQECYLVQLPEVVSPVEIFSDYAYFSSYSESWLNHVAAYVEHMIDHFGVDSGWRVVEIASNDGYLLQYFKQRGVPVLGIEPAANVAAVAEERGIPTVVEFFGAVTAAALHEAGEEADLLIGNNVLAHVPKLNDFVEGLKTVLKPRGLITMEFPHVLRLIAESQFDTVYHEHFSYFSLASADRIFASHGLRIFDVMELPTHGGSLRIYVCHAEDDSKSSRPSVGRLLRRERDAGLLSLETYAAFKSKVLAAKVGMMEFALNARRDDRTIVAYGAAAKGNTLLNYCGLGRDFIDYVVDRSPHKQGRLLPGTHIPIFHPDKVEETKPDYLLILPWNLKDEIMTQMSQIRDFGGRFVVPIPEVQVLE